MVCLLAMFRGTAGQNSVLEFHPRDCSDVPSSSGSGVYWIHPNPVDPKAKVQAFCQEDDGGGNMWTVFQRRDNIQPRQDFNQSFSVYGQGFGNLAGEFWLGLEPLALLTAQTDRQYELRVDLEDVNGTKRHATYTTFRISTREDGYRLWAIGYSGDAGDGLQLSRARKFSTWDEDVVCCPWIKPVASWFSCVRVYGAWWHDGTPTTKTCSTTSSLNGQYVEGGGLKLRGLRWGVGRELRSYKKSEMKIRPLIDHL